MLEIGAVVWGVTDIARAVEFWCEALDYKPARPPCEDFAILIPREGEGFQLSINKVTSPRARRHHMDLFADDAKAEVERLLLLGAERKEWDYEPGADYTVLTDLDGNPFCVVQK